MRTAFSVSKSVPAKVAAIVIPVAASGPIPSGVGLNRAQLAALGFEGKTSQTHTLTPAAGKTAVRVLIGIGDVRDLNTSVLRNVAASAARACARYESIATTLPGVIRGSAKASTQAVVEGFALPLHRWVALKNDKSGLAKLTSITLVSAEKTADVQAGMVMGIATSTAVCTARDFANTPPSHLTARQFAEHAVAIANASGLEATVYNRDQLIAMGCGGIVGVNAGSTEPPRMVKLVYTPASAKGKVVLVGKGVMYDSGGISLKPTNESHAAMKMDMSGAAAVLSTMGALRAMKVKTQVTAYLMCTDNMPSGSALKLGDVLTMRNGKTVEIHNTDAEGRLILADGLSLAAELKPSAIINIATLTGACLVALGEKVAGVLGTNDKLIAQLEDAAARVDEPIWQLPLVKEYRRLLDSTVADMRNIGGPAGGTITAGLFLSEFVGNTPWAHLDIAGPMKVDGDDGWMQRGATAFGTRLLIDTVTSFKPV